MSGTGFEWSGSKIALLFSSALLLSCSLLDAQRATPCRDAGADACSHLNIRHPIASSCWYCGDDGFCRSDGRADDINDCAAPPDAGQSTDGGPSNDAGPSVCPEACEGDIPYCDSETLTCVECTEDEHCSDGNFCNGIERCDNLSCESGTNPCAGIRDAVCSGDRCLRPSRVFVSQWTRNGEHQDFDFMINSCTTEVWETLVGGGGGMFMPWISFDDMELAAALLPYIGEQRRFALAVTGTLIAEDWDDLTDGTLLHAIDEHFHEPAMTGGFAWTSTDSAGQEIDEGRCSNWTSSDGAQTATTGDYASTSSTWSNASSQPCNAMGRWYCLEVFPAELPHKLAFVTASTYRPGIDFHSVADARAICESLGDALGDPSKTWDVWLSYNDIDDPMADPWGRFTHFDGPYVTVTDLMIAKNFDDLVDGSTMIALRVDNEGTFYEGEDGDYRVWTGTSPTGESVANDCDGWQSSSASDSARHGDAVLVSQSWTGWPFHLLGCDQAARLYCFEQ